MSSHQFVETLQSLGYQKANSLDPASLEWLFERNMAPFMNWFCRCLKTSNVISPEEQHQFSELEALRTVVQEGDQDHVSKELLRDDIELLKKDIRRQQQRKGELIRHRNLLRAHLRSQKNMLLSAENSQANGKLEYRKALDQTVADDNAKKDSDDRLGKSVTEIMELYDLPNQTYHDQKEQNQAIFLSQVRLHNLQKVEEKFIQEITKYSKKQFFEGIAEMAGQSGGTRFDILDISDPKSLLVHGENAEAYLRYSTELLRLKAIYAPSERLLIESRVDKAGHEGVHNEMKALLGSLHKQSLNNGNSTLRYELNQMKSAHQTMQRDIMFEIEEGLPNLLMENMESQVLPIITGDYNLKIARQDYFASHQDQLIHYLVVQRARNEFLSMAYELEWRNHRYVHRLLRSIHSQLISSEDSHQERMMLMDDPRLTVDKYQRGTIDSRDTPLLRLHDVLASSSVSSHQLYQKFSSLLEGADMLCHLLSSTEVKLTDRFDHDFEQLSKLQSSLRKGEALLCYQSDTPGGLPHLTPLPILKAHGSLEKLLIQLEEAIRVIICSVDEKKSILRRYPTSRAEREIFHFFLVAPNKLAILFAKISQQKRMYTVS